MNATAPLDHAPVRVLAPVVFTVEYLLGCLLQWRRPLPALDGIARFGLGAALIAAGLALGFGALVPMRRAGTSPNPHVASTALIESGTFRMTRNPMYVGMVLIFGGLAVALRTTWALALLPLAVLIVDRWVIVPEERYLAERFGDSYRAYCRRVRRWI